MSFALELYADVSDREQAERVAEATASSGHVAVVAGRRRRWGRPLPPSIHLDGQQAQDVLSDDADWSEDAFTFSNVGRHNLAATVLALSEVLDAGWAVRAYWGGDPLDGEREVTAHELADLIEQSRLDRRTLYRVRPWQSQARPAIFGTRSAGLGSVAISSATSEAARPSPGSVSRRSISSAST